MSELMVPQHRKQQRRSKAIKKETADNGRSGKAVKPKQSRKAQTAEGVDHEASIPNGSSRSTIKSSLCWFYLQNTPYFVFQTTLKYCLLTCFCQSYLLRHSL